MLEYGEDLWSVIHEELLSSFEKNTQKKYALSCTLDRLWILRKSVPTHRQNKYWCKKDSFMSYGASPTLSRESCLFLDYANYDESKSSLFPQHSTRMSTPSMSLWMAIKYMKWKHHPQISVLSKLLFPYFLFSHRKWMYHKSLTLHLF